MSALLEIYRAQLKSAILVELQYRAALLIWLIGTVLDPVVYLTVWATAARSSGGEVGDFSARDFAAYFIVRMLVNHLTFTWIMWEYEWRIRQGVFSALLLRPIHPIHKDIADNVTYKLLGLTVLLPTAAVLTLVYRPAWHFQPWAVAAFAPALILAFFLRFFVEWTLALSAFWTTRVTAINQMYYLVLLFMSGLAVPLELLPGHLRVLTAVLPFRWMVAFPVELLLGRLTPGQALVGFAAQVGWLALALAGPTVGWRVAARRYSAVGA